MFDVKSNKAICVLPWIHEYKQANGKYSEIEVLAQDKIDLFTRKHYYDNITKELM